MNLSLLPRAQQFNCTIQAEAEVIDILVDGINVVGIKAVGRNPDTGETGGVLTVRAKRPSLQLALSAHQDYCGLVVWRRRLVHWLEKDCTFTLVVR